MALEDMLKTLESEGKKEQQSIIEEAKKRGKAIIEKSKEEAKHLKQEEVDKALYSLSGEKARLINEARLQVKKEVVSAKEEGIKELYTKVEKELAKLRKSKKYSQIMEKMISEAIIGTNSHFEIQVNDRDIKLTEKILSNLGTKATIKGGLESLGGVVVVTDEGRVVIHNTLESRLEKAKQYIKADLMRMVYEE